jgi:ribonucleotide monophosphatase NagD (HAD superfamily)
LYFSNPDLWWPAQFQLPRLGQGAFKASLEGLWKAVTGGAALIKTQFGKPSRSTFAYAENRLIEHKNIASNSPGLLERIYMVGDNPRNSTEAIFSG